MSTMPFNDDGHVFEMGYWPDYGSKSERIMQSRRLIRTSSRLKSNRAANDTVARPFNGSKTTHTMKHEA